jgi:glycerol uptake facilitator protein
MHKSSLWQRSAAEFIGVFLMTSIGLMTVATAITSGAYGLFELSIAFAFVIMVIVVTVGAYSGSHVNPAVTLALAAYGRFSWKEVPAYIGAQIAGGVAGSAVLYWLYAGPIRAYESANGIIRGEPNSAITAMIFYCFAPNPAIAAANKWTDVINTPMAFAAEAFATAVLTLVLFLMLDPRNGFAPSLKSFALTFGLVVGFIIMVEAPLTMAGINPARDLGPRILAWIMEWGDIAFPGLGPAWWVWTLGPIVGALIGGGVAVGMGRWLQQRRANEPAFDDSPLGAAVEPVESELRTDEPDFEPAVTAAGGTRTSTPSTN